MGFECVCVCVCTWGRSGSAQASHLEAASKLASSSYAARLTLKPGRGAARGRAAASLRVARVHGWVVVTVR